MLITFRSIGLPQDPFVTQVTQNYISNPNRTPDKEADDILSLFNLRVRSSKARISLWARADSLLRYVSSLDIV